MYTTHTALLQWWILHTLHCRSGAYCTHCAAAVVHTAHTALLQWCILHCCSGAYCKHGTAAVVHTAHTALLHSAGKVAARSCIAVLLCHLGVSTVSVQIYLARSTPPAVVLKQPAVLPQLWYLVHSEVLSHLWYFSIP